MSGVSEAWEFALNTDRFTAWWMVILFRCLYDILTIIGV